MSRFSKAQKGFLGFLSCLCRISSRYQKNIGYISIMRWRWYLPFEYSKGVNLIKKQIELALRENKALGPLHEKLRTAKSRNSLL